MPDVPVHWLFIRIWEGIFGWAAIGIPDILLYFRINYKNMDKSKSEKRKRIRSKRRVKGEWPDKKTRELISYVELRPELWDGSSSGNKTPKTQLWQEVATQLGDTYVWHDCRIKWQNLRVTYRCNQAKIRNFAPIGKKKSEQGIAEESHVQWRFFKSMQFIDSIDTKQPNKSSSSSNLKVVSCSEPFESKFSIFWFLSLLP